jgi:hypothetical protein
LVLVLMVWLALVLVLQVLLEMVVVGVFHAHQIQA